MTLAQTACSFHSNKVTLPEAFWTERGIVILWFLFSRIFESENKSIENKKESRWFFLGAHPFPGN